MDNGQISILLVEDDSIASRLVERILSKDSSIDCKLHIVQELAPARAMMDEQEFDCVILDLNLPDSSGIETIESVRAANRQIPIIVQSAIDDKDIGMQAISKGADYYLVKGEFMAERLVRSIKYAAEHRQKKMMLEHKCHQMDLRDSQELEKQSKLLKSQIRKAGDAVTSRDDDQQSIDVLS